MVERFLLLGAVTTLALALLSHTAGLPPLLTAAIAKLEVTVKPGAKAPGIVCDAEGAIVVRVREPARDGRANEAVRVAIAGLLDVAKSKVELVRGASARRKTFAIHGIDPDGLRNKIGRLSEASRSHPRG